jgi:hypothetical protein
LRSEVEVRPRQRHPGQPRDPAGELVADSSVRSGAGVEPTQPWAWRRIVASSIVVCRLDHELLRSRDGACRPAAGDSRARVQGF